MIRESRSGSAGNFDELLLLPLRSFGPEGPAHSLIHGLACRSLETFTLGKHERLAYLPLRASALCRFGFRKLCHKPIIAQPQARFSI